MKKRRRENGKKDYLAGRRPKSGARTRKPDGYCGVSMKKTWTVLLAVLSLLAALVLSLFSLIRQGRGR